MKKIILFELNEVPFQIVDYFVRKYPQSLLARLLPNMAQYETLNEDEGHLSPWITWPTLHRGVTNRQHGIKDFGEDFSEVDSKYPPIWKILKNAGISTGVFASMHSYPLPADYQEYAFYVPDPFAGDERTHPARLMPFQRFNLRMSRRSARNVDSGIDIGAALSLATSLPGLGIRPGTLAEVAGQLLKEHRHAWIKTRRRTYQSVLAFDIFMKLMRDRQPAFTTCFSNHVASAMHRYWAAAFPQDYDRNDLGPEWQKTYSGEIDFAMHKFDGFLQQLANFVDQHPEYQLLITSSMGQSATVAEKVATETYCPDLNALMKFFGLETGQYEIRSAMHPQYNLSVAEPYIPAFRQALSQVVIGEKPLVFREKEHGFFSIDLGHKNLPVDYAVYQGRKVPFAEIGLTNEKIEDETGSTAYHIPQGILLVYEAGRSFKGMPRRSGLSTTAIVPSLLENFGVPVPAYATTQRIEELQS